MKPKIIIRQPTANTNALVATQVSEESTHKDTELASNELRVCSKIYPPPPDRVVAPSIPEHRISLHIANQDHLERRLDGGKLLCAPMGPGVFNFVPANRESESLWEAEVELLSIYLPPAVLERTAVESCDCVPHTIELLDHFAIRDPFLEQLGFALKAEIERSNSINRLYLESLQTVLAVHLLRYHCSTTIAAAAVSGGLPKSKLQQVIDYIQNNLDCDTGLEELARVAQMSSHHFGKLFKQSMGATPHQYVLKCRIERAKKLLSEKRLSIAEISQVTGFCHQGHFTDVFRRYTTLTPRQYRNRL